MFPQKRRAFFSDILAAIEQHEQAGGTFIRDHMMWSPVMEDPLRSSNLSYTQYSMLLEDYLSTSILKNCVWKIEDHENSYLNKYSSVQCWLNSKFLKQITLRQTVKKMATYKESILPKHIAVLPKLTNWRIYTISRLYFKSTQNVFELE